MNISDASLVLGLTVSPNEGVGLASAQRDMGDFFFFSVQKNPDHSSL